MVELLPAQKQVGYVTVEKMFEKIKSFLTSYSFYMHIEISCRTRLYDIHLRTYVLVWPQFCLKILKIFSDLLTVSHYKSNVVMGLR